MKEKFDSQDEIDRDFSIYESGILRLKDLEDRLNHLNTLGFWKFEKKIRSKLKKVGEIPRIEAELNSLEKRIVMKYGKKNLYKKALPPLKRKKNVRHKKKEFVLGAAPEPVPIPEDIKNEESENLGHSKNNEKITKKHSLMSLVQPLKKISVSKNYEEEVKGAVHGGNGRAVVVVDSVLEIRKKKMSKDLEQEMARLEIQRKHLEEKEEAVKRSHAKYHSIALNGDGYSHSGAGVGVAIDKLIEFRNKKSKNHFLKEISK
jgi:hypothetical protein